MFQDCLSKGSISQDIFSLQFFNFDMQACIHKITNDNWCLETVSDGWSFFTESNERYNAPQVLKIYKSYHFHDHVNAIICI